jgi:hypothetical protein
MKTKLFIILAVVISLSACKKEDINEDNTSIVPEKVSINGYAQKGPFINGASVTLTELDNDFNQTGKNYNTQIIDNTGLYELSDISLASNYAEIRVNGFYFNEVCGEQSNSQITLNGIVDISDNSSLNINILTQLEKSRVEYLLTTGENFTDAKKQAQSEILNIFNINIEDTILNSEQLNISNSTEGDAILIAISSILQGYRTESQLSDLIANISTDIRTDGILNSNSIGSNLLTHAKLLDTTLIKNNIEQRYNNLGLSVTVPYFGKYIKNFITNSNFTDTVSVINYPENGLNGANILDINRTDYPQSNFSLSANIPSDCLSLKIKISFISSSDSCPYWYWFYALSSIQNWNISEFNNIELSQVFTSTGQSTDLEMLFNKGVYLIEYYENNAELPNRNKTININ